MAGQFWFPSMSVPEIVDAFAGWGIAVSNEQVARPSSEFVMTIYSACLEQVTGITQESLQSSVEAALATTETPDLYAEALSQNYLIYHIQRFASAAKVTDFNTKDVYFPNPERTRSIFSAFINFVKFSEQCEPFITRLRDKSASALKERDEVGHQLVDMKEKLAAVKTKREEDEPKCATLRKENTAMTAQLVSYKETQMTLLTEVESLKQQREEVISKKESVNDQINMEMDSINRTRSRIVQSPERIKRNIVTMGATASEDKKTVATHETKIRDLQAKIAALLNIEKEVRSCVEQLQIIEKEMHALDVSQKDLMDLKDNLDRKKGERNELMMKRERVHKQLSNAQEKLERAQHHAEDKRVMSQQTIERLQREYEEMAVERRDNDRQVEEIRTEADEIERKMAEHMKKSQAELNELLAEYWKLRHETEVYMETLANKLRMQVTST
ncbi:Nuf2 family-domain-containing protein [Sparassis latifolia]